jgi:hypothetical protein
VTTDECPAWLNQPHFQRGLDFQPDANIHASSVEHLEQNWDARRIALTPDEVTAIGTP